MGNIREQELLIQNKLGLHARAATKLATLSSQFDSKIDLYQENKVAPADSVMALLMLESSQGKYVTVRAEGPDADSAIQAISKLINDKFDEQE